MFLFENTFFAASLFKTAYIFLLPVSLLNKESEPQARASSPFCEKVGAQGVVD